MKEARHILIGFAAAELCELPRQRLRKRNAVHHCKSGGSISSVWKEAVGLLGFEAVSQIK